MPPRRSRAGLRSACRPGSRKGSAPCRPNIPRQAQAQEEIAELENRLRQLRGDGVSSELEQSEAKFRALTETAASAIFIIQDGRFVYMNPAGQELSGYSLEELRAMDFLSIVHPDFRAQTGQYAKDRLEGRPVPTRYEIKIVTKDGRELWAELTAAYFEHQGRAGHHRHGHRHHRAQAGPGVVAGVAKAPGRHHQLFARPHLRPEPGGRGDRVEPGHRGADWHRGR